METIRFLLGTVLIVAGLLIFIIEILGNYGMQYARVDENGKLVMLREETVPCDREKINGTVNQLRKRFGFTTYRGESTLFFRSGCACFPF